MTATDLKLAVLKALVELNVAEDRLIDLAKRVFEWLTEPSSVTA